MMLNRILPHVPIGRERGHERETEDRDRWKDKEREGDRDRGAEIEAERQREEDRGTEDKLLMISLNRRNRLGFDVPNSCLS
jgi:hypothetical protein